MANQCHLTKQEWDQSYSKPFSSMNKSMNHHFLSFRGAQLEEKQVLDWIYLIKSDRGSVTIPSMISSSENIQVALRFA